jgi:hypothetical protein
MRRSGSGNLLVFVELLEQAAGYFEAFFHADEAADTLGGEEGVGDDTEEGPDAEGNLGGEEDLTAAQRAVDLALASGFMLRTKAEGWKLWCERLSLPPFLFWEKLPGFDRLQRAPATTTSAWASPWTRPQPMLSSRGTPLPRTFRRPWRWCAAGPVVHVQW